MSKGFSSILRDDFIISSSQLMICECSSTPTSTIDNNYQRRGFPKRSTMPFPHHLNTIRTLLLVATAYLTRTNAYLPRLPVNHALHQTHFSRNSILDNIAKEERLARFEKSSVGKNRIATEISAVTTDGDGGKEASQATLLGALVLLTVPLSWGTYVPVGELMYRDQFRS